MTKRKIKTKYLICDLAMGLLILLGLIIRFGMPGYRFSSLIAFGVAGIALCYRLLGLLARRFPKTAKGLRLTLTACICLGLVIVFATGIVVVRASFGSPDTPCQYVIVLGAGVDGSVPSLTLRERLDAAYEYLVKNPEAVCIVSGGQGPGENITEAACMFADLTGKGIPAERIWQEDAATNTRENIANSLALIEERTGVRPEVAGIISSEYHLYRAAMFAREQGLAAVGIPAKTRWVSLRINYFLREIAGVWHHILLGV